MLLTSPGWKTIGPAFAGLVLAALAGGQVITCPGAGLLVQGGRFGDPWAFSIYGPPNASALLASDVAGGHIMTPFGPVCLGLTASLVAMPITLDSAGVFAQSGTLPFAAPFPPGSMLFTQAALAHPSLPGGYAFTNGAALTFKPPRIGVFRWIGAANTFTSIDGFNDSVAVSLSVPPWQGAEHPLHIPSLGWYAWRINDGSLYCVDDLTGANVHTVSGIAPGGTGDWNQTIVPSEDGSLLFLWAQTFNDGVKLKTYSLLTGTLLSTWTGTIPYFSFRGLYPIPGTSLAYVCDGNQILVIDGAAGTLVTTIPLLGFLYGQWGKYAFLRQGYLYMVFDLSGTGQSGFVQVIDTAAHAIVGTSAPILGWIQPLTIATGSSGAPALWLSVQAPAAWTLTEVSLATLAASSVAPLTPGPSPVLDCIGTAGGTELLILEGNGSLASLVNVTTGQVTPILSGATSIGVLRSTTLTKAYALGNSGVLSFPTDPAGPAIGIPLPPATAFVWHTRLISN